MGRGCDGGRGGWAGAGRALGLVWRLGGGDGMRFGMGLVAALALCGAGWAGEEGGIKNSHKGEMFGSNPQERPNNTLSGSREEES